MAPVDLSVNCTALDERLTVFADMGPKPMVTLRLQNPPEGTYYLVIVFCVVIMSSSALLYQIIKRI